MWTGLHDSGPGCPRPAQDTTDDTGVNILEKTENAEERAFWPENSFKREAGFYAHVIRRYFFPV